MAAHAEPAPSRSYISKDPSQISNLHLAREASSTVVEDLLQGAFCPVVGDVVRRDPSHVRRVEHRLTDEPRDFIALAGDSTTLPINTANAVPEVNNDSSSHFAPTQAPDISPNAVSEGASKGPSYSFPSCPPVPLKFNDLTYDVKVQKATEGLEAPGFLARLGACVGIGGQGEMVDLRVLHGISGYFRPGRLVALMGGSGAGKSTLLNLLSFRATASTGSVYYGGMVANDEVARAQSGFVQQLDLFIQNLSVEEHLEAQMRLRLPQDTPAHEREERMNMLINQLSLVRCRHTPIGTASGIGGISGGEKKRLNVASELVTMPPVLFADEPTTGLDSHMAISTIRILRALASSGRTVVATIHQPSSKVFELFDDVVLLAEGRLLFSGDRLACVGWLKDLGFECPPLTNPADFIIKVAGMPEGDEARRDKLRQVSMWSEKWHHEGQEFLRKWEISGRDAFVSSAQNFLAAQAAVAGGEKQILSRASNSFALSASRSSFFDKKALVDDTPNTDLDNGSAPFRKKKTMNLSWWQEMVCLTKRALSANKRDRMLIHARAGQTIVLGLFFGFLMFRLDWSLGGSRARLGSVYSQMLNQAMAGAFGVINTFGFEKPFVRREYESGLIRPSAYITAKMVADIPVQIVFPIIFVTLMYWLTGTRDHFGRFVVMTIIVLLVANSAMSIGYMSSALGESVSALSTAYNDRLDKYLMLQTDVAAVICNLAILPITVFGGFMVKLNEASPVLSWIQYLSFVKYGFENAAVNAFGGAEVEVAPGETIPGEDFIYNSLGFTDKYYALYFILLVVMVIAYRVFAAFAFTWSLSRRKENG